MKSTMTSERFFTTIEENINKESTGKQQENGWAGTSPSINSSLTLCGRNRDDLIKSDKKLAKKNRAISSKLCNMDLCPLPLMTKLASARFCAWNFS